MVRINLARSKQPRVPIDEGVLRLGNQHPVVVGIHHLLSVDNTSGGPRSSELGLVSRPRRAFSTSSTTPRSSHRLLKVSEKSVMLMLRGLLHHRSRVVVPVRGFARSRGGPPPPAAPPKAPVPADPWQEVKDPATGQVYWWNTQTNETTAVGAPKPTGPTAVGAPQGQPPAQPAQGGGFMSTMAEGLRAVPKSTTHLPGRFKK